MNVETNRRGFIRTTGMAALALSSAPAGFAMESGNLTVALVGCAHIHTPNYVKLLRHAHGVQVKWVWDHDAERAARIAHTLRAQVAASPDQIWSDSAVRGVVICSETNRHGELVGAAARAGKPMFAEKPMGTSGRESWEMAAAIEQAHVQFTTGYFMRTDPIHLFLRDEVARGAFGRISKVSASNCHEGSLKGWFDTEYRWMADPKIAGVGAFGDLGTHKLDILMWIFGDIDSVAAEIKVVTGRYGDCDESGVALIRFKSGLTGTLSAGWVDLDDPVKLHISGTEAHAVVIHDKLYYTNPKVSGATGTFAFHRLPAELPEPLEQFLTAISGGRSDTLVKPREAAARVAAMEAMYQAARTHQWAQPA